MPATGLFATWCCFCEDHCSEDCETSAWRVGYDDSFGEPWAIDVDFVRKRDVEIVIAHLEREGWTASRLHAFPHGSGKAPAVVRDAIAAALPW